MYHAVATVHDNQSLHIVYTTNCRCAIHKYTFYGVGLTLHLTRCERLTSMQPWWCTVGSPVEISPYLRIVNPIL